MACLICGGNCQTVCSGANQLPVPGAFEPYTVQMETFTVGFPKDWTLEKANAEIFRLRQQLEEARAQNKILSDKWQDDRDRRHAAEKALEEARAMVDELLSAITTADLPGGQTMYVTASQVRTRLKKLGTAKSVSARNEGVKEGLEMAAKSIGRLAMILPTPKELKLGREIISDAQTVIRALKRSASEKQEKE